jgi:hypothetical protein
MQNAEEVGRSSVGFAAFAASGKSKCGGREVMEANRFRSTEDENAKLKKLLAEAMLISRCRKTSRKKKW